jgi:hypothetical protein
MATSPMLMLTGSSGSAKGVASGVGRLGPSGGSGGRVTVRRSAVRASISSRPGQEREPPPVQSRVFKNQPFPLAVRDGQTVQFCLR